MDFQNRPLHFFWDNVHNNHSVDIREHMQHAFFIHISSIYVRIVGRVLQRISEFFILFLAIICLITFVCVHLWIQKLSVACLSQVKDKWSRKGILRIEYIHNHYQEFGNIEHLYQPIKLSDDLSKENCQSDHCDKKSFNNLLNFENKLKNKEYTEGNYLVRNLTANKNFLVKDENRNSNVPILTNWIQDHIIEYSVEDGLLSLSDEGRKQFNIPVATFSLSSENRTCFDNKFIYFILEFTIGYDYIFISSIKNNIATEDNYGFIKNVLTDELYKIVKVHKSYIVYFRALIAMFFFIALISMLLRYAHNLVFFFIVDFSNRDFNGNIIFPWIPLLTVIFALIGIHDLLTEFFDDTTIPFIVILIVWIADQYDAICCHTAVSKRYWLRFFYLYHFAFYAYHFKGHYSSLALFTSCLFIKHSMLYFFHHYELPAAMNRMTARQAVVRSPVYLRNFME